MSDRKILFTPESDITAYELAVIMGNVIPVHGEEFGPLKVISVLSKMPINCDDKHWSNMPPSIRRHWTVQP